MNRLLDELGEPKEYFSKVYVQNLWGGILSRSGPGSEGDFANQKIKVLTEIIADYEINSILDIGCGDFYWMKEIAPLLDHYHGIDVVDDLVINNKKQYEGAKVSFQSIDVSKPDDQKLLNVRKVDLVTCLDVIGHLLNDEIDSLLSFILCDLEIKFLVVTNRREAASAYYLKRAKTRHEGIDLEQHPLFLKRKPVLLKQVPGLFPNDFFQLYSLVSE